MVVPALVDTAEMVENMGNSCISEQSPLTDQIITWEVFSVKRRPISTAYFKNYYLQATAFLSAPCGELAVLSC